MAKWIEKDKIDSNEVQNLEENDSKPAEIIENDPSAQVIENKENVPTENPKR